MKPFETGFGFYYRRSDECHMHAACAPAAAAALVRSEDDC